MAGDSVPLVLFPRYTTFAGWAGHDWTTLAMDVTPYDRAFVTAWRGVLVGSATPSFTLWFEESMDQGRWTSVPGTSPAGQDPGENTQHQYGLAPIHGRWLRARVRLGGDDNVVSCWVAGHLEERLR